MTPDIMIKGIRPDLGTCEYRIIDLDNDREPIRDGDLATINGAFGAITYDQFVAACKADSIARGYSFFSA